MFELMFRNKWYKKLQYSYFSLVVHKTTIHNLEAKILGNISVDENKDQTAIGHHELWNQIKHSS